MSGRLRLVSIAIVCLMMLSLNNNAQAVAIEDNDQPDLTLNHRNCRSQRPSMVVQITDAYYDDLDNDGQEDDVRLEFTVNLNGYSDEDLEDGINLRFKIFLMTPSLMKYQHYFNLETNDNELLFVLDLLNHAIDNGWYYASVKMRNLDNFHQRAGFDYIIFDPPGGHAGGDPRLKGFVTSKSGMKTINA